VKKDQPLSLLDVAGTRCQVPGLGEKRRKKGAKGERPPALPHFRDPDKFKERA